MSDSGVNPTSNQDPTERRWQIAMIVLTIAVIGAAIRLSGAFGGDDGPYEPIPSSDQAYSVIDALALSGLKPTAIEGYVFDGSARGLRLCTTREPGNPPRCVGPYLSIEGVDAGFLIMEPGTDRDGVAMSYHDERIILVGTIAGTVLTVTDIIAT